MKDNLNKNNNQIVENNPLQHLLIDDLNQLLSEAVRNKKRTLVMAIIDEKIRRIDIAERVRIQPDKSLTEIEAWYQLKKSQGAYVLNDPTEALSFWCGAIANLEWLIVENYKLKQALESLTKQVG